MLIISENHKQDLKFLHELPTQYFCKLAWSFLSKGHNLKLYQTASQKLQSDVKQIQSGVEGLAYLFVEAGKYELSEEEFKEAIKNLDFEEEVCNSLYNEYLNQKSILDCVLTKTGVQHPEFKDLEWRFETVVSSRSLKNQIQPRVILKLELENKGKSENICLQSDIPNIIHMNQLINQALQESKTQHSKRIQRAVA